MKNMNFDDFFDSLEKKKTKEELEQEHLHKVVDAKPHGLADLLKEHYPELFI